MAQQTKPQSDASSRSSQATRRSAGAGESDHPVATDYTGETLDSRYHLTQLLGKGGMASVYLARHIVIGRPVAVKILDARCVTERDGIKRLFREAQAAAAIGHPNIVEVLDVGVTAARDPYLVMEYLEGEDLASLLQRKGRLSLAAACSIMEPVTLALGAAHAKNIVHRDLKPANILLARRADAPPAVKLIDFGISKFIGLPDQDKITLTGALLGTPAYMSPEQARGVQDVDARADIYAVGVMLYQMLAGKLPFKGSNYNELIFKIVNDEPQLPESTLQSLPEEARALVQQAMSKDPKDRQQSAAQLLDALKSLNAWSRRSDAFLELASDIKSSAFGGGELATSTKVSAESPAQLLGRIVRDATDEQFVRTLAECRPTSAVRRRRWVRPVAAAAALFAASAIAVTVWLRSPAEKSLPAPALGHSNAPKAQPLEEGVQITISGVPKGATIRYDGAPVFMNPFRVKPTNTIVPIRVELPGHEPFITTVVPSQDLTVRVALSAVNGSGKTKRAAAEDAPAETSPAAKHRPARQRPAPEAMGHSGRDTLYSEKFE
jgi:hypothetical protein